MVIDTSALVAMLNDEPEAERLEAAVGVDHVRLMSTASYLETAIVIETRFGEPGGRELDLWLHRAAVDLVAVDADQAEAARVAYRLYGKGRHRRRIELWRLLLLRPREGQRPASALQG